MIVYSATKQHFLRDNNDREIDEVIRSSFVRTTGHRVSENEQRSWRESLGYMARLLVADDIPADVGIAVGPHIRARVADSSSTASTHG